MWPFTRKNKNKTQVNPGLSEYSLVWNVKIQTKERINWMGPFRTEVKAETKEKAKQKLLDRIKNNTTVWIGDDQEYKKSDLGQIKHQFEIINKEFNDIFNINLFK